MARERDFRNALEAALVATGQFSEVTLKGLPENYGEAASDLTAVSIQPHSTQIRTGWDAALGGGRVFQCQLVVTILARHSDPVLGDELAEQLLNTLRNVADGGVLVAGFNEPQRTQVTGWQWKTRTDVERRIAAILTYDYLQDGWNGADTTP